MRRKEVVKAKGRKKAPWTQCLAGLFLAIKAALGMAHLAISTILIIVLTTARTGAIY